MTPRAISDESQGKAGFSEDDPGSTKLMSSICKESFWGAVRTQEAGPKLKRTVSLETQRPKRKIQPGPRGGVKSIPRGHRGCL